MNSVARLSAIFPRGEGRLIDFAAEQTSRDSRLHGRETFGDGYEFSARSRLRSFVFKLDSSSENLRTDVSVDNFLNEAEI